MGDSARKPPYGAIRDILADGELIPFFGAGASLRPKHMKDERYAKHGAVSVRELCAHLVENSEYPDGVEDEPDLAKIASYYESETSRDRLTKKVSSFIECDRLPLTAQENFAWLSKQQKEGKKLLIVTTNYDRLLEKAFQNEGEPYEVIAHCSDNEAKGAMWSWVSGPAGEPAAAPTKKSVAEVSELIREEDGDRKIEKTVIYKIHGDIQCCTGKNPDTMVISEDDYLEFIQKMYGRASIIPAAFKRHLESSHLLFMGYSLKDWNLRLLLRSISLERAAKRHWAIQLFPSSAEEVVWQQRKVTIYDMDVTDFVDRLCDRPSNDKDDSEEAGSADAGA